VKNMTPNKRDTTDRKRHKVKEHRHENR
jgi:hypothetical protein